MSTTTSALWQDLVTARQEPLDIEADVSGVTFTANGEYLVGGGEKNVRVWKVKDGEEVATMVVETPTCCVAVSKDGKFIAAGSFGGEVVVWDATTYNRVFVHKTGVAIPDLDFSPNSSRLVFASGETTTIWDIDAGQQVYSLDHNDSVGAAKYSPQGDRIATATSKSAQVWDSDDGRLLVDLEVELCATSCLLWYNDYFIINTRGGKIKQIDAVTGSTLFEWSVPTANRSNIAMPQHGMFIACAAETTIAFVYTSTYTQPQLNPCINRTYSVALSPDGQHIAVAENEKITIKLKCCLAPDSDSHAQDPAFKLWRQGQLTEAEALLIPTPQNRAGALASRALARAHLQKWDEALVDADESIKLLPTTFGYIAKAFALAGMGEKSKAIRVCDMASLRSRLEDAFPLLLFKAIVLFVAGEHADALSRIDDLIADTWEVQRLRVIQAYMHLRLGNLHMESYNFEGAIQSFEAAQIKLGDHTHPSHLMIIPLLFGRTCDDLAFTIRQHLCEALLAVGRTKEAGECVLRIAGQEKTTEPIKAWVSDFIQRCLSTTGNDGGSSWVATLHSNTSIPEEALHVSSLLRVWIRSRLTTDQWKDVLAAAAGFVLPRLVIYQAICERLEMTDQVADAVACFHQMSSKMADEIDGEEGNWTHDFASRCSVKLINLGERFMNAKRYDEAISQYTAALSLNPANPQDLLVRRSNASLGKGVREDAINDAKEWARLILMAHSWKDALGAAAGFELPRLAVYQTICEHLEMTDHVAEAVACFHQMESELAQEISGEQGNWICDFVSRCSSKLEKLGATFMDDKQYETATSQYTAALSLNPRDIRGLLVNRSKAFVGQGKWKDALDDAKKAIEIDPSSPFGYEREFAAFVGMERHDDAINAFKTMLSKMSKSSNPKIRELSRHYIRPEKTINAIRASIKDAIRGSPLVLINTVSGRLCNKAEQAIAFESTPAFSKLIVSMTTGINQALIDQVVGEFYRYVTLSHTWQADEPLYEHVIRIVVYDLGPSLTHDKLRMFCGIVREEGYTWAWSDTCCINKADHFVLQEALVSMFKWYEGSAMTLIFLFDVDKLAGSGALIRSIWNSRGWTLQEYHASKVVRIYTRDWTPYLGLTIHNHKEAPEIISEMEEATGISAQALMAIRPGLSDIREKLRLASTRQTTRIEDAAYSLLGIFSMTMPATYGEDDKALSRLLSQLLMSSGDTSILAWTGTSSGFNTCLPSEITVFSQLPTSHIPLTIADAEMETLTSRLRASSIDLDLVTRLHDQLDRLPTPIFAGQRLKLPCLAFKIKSISGPYRGPGLVFRAQAPLLGTVEIKTRVNIKDLKNLYLIHPWIDFLLDRRVSEDSIEVAPDEHEVFEEDAFASLDEFSELSTASDEDSLEGASLPSPLPMETQTNVYEFLARLRQPFGALLFIPSRRNAEYKRILADSLITARVEEITSTTLDALTQNVRVLDVL